MAVRRPGAPRTRAGVLVLAAIIAALAALGFAAIRRNDANPTQGEQLQQIASGLHCPICKDLSVADSPAPLAQQMRAQIATGLRAGKSAAQIRAGFVAAYGDSVLMAPPRSGLAGAAYYVPPAVVLVGLVGTALLLRRWRSPSESADQGPEVTDRQRRAVKQAVARLREEEPG